MFGSVYIWMWGVSIPMAFSTGTEFSIITIVGIICSILILISGLLMIFSSYKVYKGDKDTTEMVVIWFLMGLIAIIAPIIWIVITAVLTTASGFGITMNFWTFFSPGFGVIGSFVGAAFSLLGVVAYKMLNK